MIENYFSVSERKSRLHEAAVSWVGTPFHAKGAVKGPNGGVSCMGLIHAIALEIGLTEEGEFELPDGPVSWHMHNDSSLLKKFFRSKKVRGRVSRIEMQDGIEIGDLVALKVHRTEHHLAQVIDERTAIHCHRKKGVMLVSLDNIKELISGVYRIRK